LNEEIRSDDGGAFSYSQSLLAAIDERVFSEQLDVVFVSRNQLKKKPGKPFFRIQAKSRRIILLRIIFLLVNHAIVPSKIKAKVKSLLTREMEKSECEILKENNVQVVFYPHPRVEFKDVPYILNNWDIGHRSSFPFPETTHKGVFEYRENHFRVTVAKALIVIVESEAGKLELMNFYQIPEQRIKVLPMHSGDLVRLEPSMDFIEGLFSKLVIEKGKYFIYPAQFWAHKNHVNLLHGFATFILSNPEFKLVFTGSDKGNLKHIRSEVTYLNLDDSVLFLGFVSNMDLNALYRNSQGLVMASLIGPTNMPPLEGATLGIPVICSDLAGHKEQLLDYPFYFDGLDPTSIHAAMERCVAETDKPRKSMSFPPRTDLIEVYFLEAGKIRSLFY